MMATRARTNVEDGAPDLPATSPGPTVYGNGMDMNGFIWQQLNDIQRTLGAIQESQKQLTTAQEKSDSKTSAKLATIETELTSIRQIKHTATWIFSIALIVGGIAMSGVVFVAKEIWSISKPVVMEKLAAPHQAASKPQP